MALHLVRLHNFRDEILNITQASLELIKSGAVRVATIAADVLFATAITAFLLVDAPTYQFIANKFCGHRVRTSCALGCS